MHIYRRRRFGQGAIEGISFFFFYVQSRIFVRNSLSSHQQQHLEIIMLITGEDVVRNVIFKNALIPFTCGQFSESTALHYIVRLQLLCTRCFISNIFLLYLSHFKRTYLYFFEFFDCHMLHMIIVRFSIHFGLLSRTSVACSASDFINVWILFP